MMKTTTVLIILATLQVSRGNILKFMNGDCYDVIECLVNITKDQDTNVVKLDLIMFPRLKSIILRGQTKRFQGPNNVVSLRRISTEDTLWLWDYVTRNYKEIPLKFRTSRGNEYPKVGPTDNSLLMCIQSFCRVRPEDEYELRCPNKELDDILLEEQHLDYDAFFCAQKIRSINFQTLHITWNAPLHSYLLKDLIHLNLRNATFNKQRPLTADDLKRVHQLTLLDMPDNLHDIPIYKLFTSNEKLIEVDTPTFLFWRKDADVVQKFDKKRNCLYKIINTSVNKIHCYKGPQLKRTTTVSFHRSKRVGPTQNQIIEKREVETTTERLPSYNISEVAVARNFFEDHMICLILGGFLILFIISLCTLYYYKWHLFL